MLLRNCIMALRVTSSKVTLHPAVKPQRLTLIPARNLQQRFYSSQSPVIGIVDYDVVKKLPSEPQKLLIDVREPDELKETGQIPSSINIPLDVVSQELSTSDSAFKSKYGREKPKPDTEIIFHCKIGKRSLKAAEAATALGFKKVSNYEGSWLDWAKREGLPK
ncbi:rhodanese domain-containing protein CG4456 [Drosophila bipectinata]|uniref:rhodanese domain-containing protein CG4456 n=1 Tax=Drosophila bipectinata TaxID=42026 RepID=UPI001C896C19|nr:rhodanese domain-containing protein CG4456 [Drosophila bipectinata]